MKRFFYFAIFLVCPIWGVDALTCTPGYYPNNGECQPCAAQRPTGGAEPFYCPDGINRIQCPDHEYETHKDFYENLTGYILIPGQRSEFVEATRRGAEIPPTDISVCYSRLYFKTPNAYLFVEGDYTEENGYFNGPTKLYYKADPGYYLTDFVMTSWFGTGYRNVEQCSGLPNNAHYIEHPDDDQTTCPWECDGGYGRHGDVCTTLCTAGFTQLKTSSGVTVNVYADKPSTPALNISTSRGTCYVTLAAGAANSAINVSYNGTTYHTTD